MTDILEKIRKPSLFILLLILNFRFLFTVVLNDRVEILSVLTIVFFLLSFDYSTIRKEYVYCLGIFILISAFDFTKYKLNVLTPLIVMQCVSTFSLKEYLRFNIIILGTTVIGMLLVFGTGHITQSDVFSFIRIRNDFGYGHPNIAMIYYWGLFMSVLLYCYISKYRNFIWLLLGGFLLISIYLYLETDSRSFIFAVFTFSLVLIYYNLRKRSVKDYRIGYSRYVLYALPVLFTALTLYFGIFASEYPKINILFSTRPSLYHELLAGLTPLQYLLGTSAFDYIIIDSTYMHLLFEAGILLFVYFIWLYYFAMKNIVRQQNFIVIAVMVSFLVYGLMESLLLFCVIIGNNLFWVLMYRYRYGIEEGFDTEQKLLDE
ncbi:hypothetical protein [Dysgonomonas macrotermitis]|uniref:Uncharacterized protein n=1 Tax=Dysgonomonas macrotermitis TaxID=1346286 RepID=A0A1M5FTS6_9BACT|nr:hypothetical protein [Dysgonomonas macrotermitis]SHF94572.1 hypothetical protein SAMN05444362_112102 [Dysgonomonas macrotermitis]